MTSSRVLESELNKNRIDKEIADTELLNAKNRFAEEIKSVPYRVLASQPIKYKKPFKLRLREWKARKINEIIDLFRK